MANFQNPGKNVLRPASLAHVVLRTNNFDNMKRFYKTFLGAHAVFENDFLSFITYDEEHHRIGLVSMPDIGDKVKASAGLEHFAYTYNTLTDVAMAYLQRKENGILPFWTTNHGPTTSLYYKDPDGNTIETQVDNLDSPDEATAFMHSEAFKKNPLGVDFVMEDMIKRLEDGEDEASIKKRPETGPRGMDSIPA